jgi:hypothetical protein
MQVKFINEEEYIKYKFKTKPYQHQYDAFMKSKDEQAMLCLWSKELVSLKLL